MEKRETHLLFCPLLPQVVLDPFSGHVSPLLCPQLSPCNYRFLVQGVPCLAISHYMEQEGGKEGPSLCWNILILFSSCIVLLGGACYSLSATRGTCQHFFFLPITKGNLPKEKALPPICSGRAFRMSHSFTLLPVRLLRKIKQLLTNVWNIIK